MNRRLLAILLVVISLASCKDERTGKSRGPIILGDSSTIVTETNTELLQDQVPDLKPVISADEPSSSSAAADTSQKQAQTSAVETAQTGYGLSVPFKEVIIFIPGITTRSYGKPNLQKARGASYSLTGGNLNGAQMRLSGGQISKVSQRYQTTIMLKDGNDKLVLESAPKYTSEWETISGSGGAYRIAGLSGSELEYKMPSPSALRNAVQQAARRQRLNRSDTQEWLDAVRNVRSANQPPASVVLRSVMWRIEGKGFSKELRIDLE